MPVGSCFKPDYLGYLFSCQLILILPCDAGSYHLTGLVHVSEVSWDLVHDVRDILTEGDDVRVKIINIDRYFLMIVLIVASKV